MAMIAHQMRYTGFKKILPRFLAGDDDLLDSAGLVTIQRLGDRTR